VQEMVCVVLEGGDKKEGDSGRRGGKLLTYLVLLDAHRVSASSQKNAQGRKKSRNPWRKPYLPSINFEGSRESL